MSPDSRQHRGPHPSDKQLFHYQNVPALREATADLSWLLTRGYAMKSSLKLVGDHQSLKERQRLAVARAACSDSQLEHRIATCVQPEKVIGEELAIDGFNLLITLEAALSGGVLILGRDGCIRDLSGVHGSYRSVTETDRAIGLTGKALESLGVRTARWLLDKPISNSGRLAQRIRERALEHRWLWEVEVVFNPDSEIMSEDRIAVSSDSIILDRATRWFNLSRYIVEQFLLQSWVVDIRFHSEASE
ncbi:MAG TPA: DUF434 domain-containing protein [Blastocatellia bacterium]|nr:DUF434 domain-containing protein [Blastocatellia bacterium]